MEVVDWVEMTHSVMLLPELSTGFVHSLLDYSSLCGFVFRNSIE